jgi:hypothetical protein
MSEMIPETQNACYHILSTFDDSVIVKVHLPHAILGHYFDQDLQIVSHLVRHPEYLGQIAYPLVVNRQPPLQLIRAHF